MVDRAAVLVRVEADDGYCTTPGDTPRRWLLLATTTATVVLVPSFAGQASSDDSQPFRPLNIEHL